MKKKAIVSVISVICVIAVAVGIFAGCSSKKSDSNTSNSAQKGAITVISREEGSGTRDAFTELMGRLTSLISTAPSQKRLRILLSS